MIYKNKKNFKRGVLSNNLVLICFCMIAILSGCSQTPDPLVKLPPEVNDKFVKAGIKNIVFFNDDAQPIQVLDLAKGKVPEVRQITGVAKNIASQIEHVNHPEALVALPNDQVKILHEKKIPYVEYRDEKDKQIQVLELTEKGVCIPCLLASKQKLPYQSNLPLEKSQTNNLLNFVIPAAQASCSGCLPSSCSSHKCTNVSGNCCNCKK
jgi:hypothetical protein